MIIDAHAHIGHDVVFDEAQTAGELAAQCDAYGISGAVVQPFVTRPYLEDVRKAHDDVYDMTRAYPGRFWGMASLTPHLAHADYEAELKRCVVELGFVGVKVTPVAHAVHPGSVDAMHAYEVAHSLGLPVMVHTGSGAPFAEPVQVIKAARAFAGTPFVLAHAGGDAYFHQALHVATLCENVFLEPSWVNVLNIIRALKSLGPSRLMFSSDMSQNIPVELAVYGRAVQETPNPDEAWEQIAWRTAKAVFRLPV